MRTLAPILTSLALATAAHAAVTTLPLTYRAEMENNVTFRTILNRGTAETETGGSSTLLARLRPGEVSFPLTTISSEGETVSNTGLFTDPLTFEQTTIETEVVFSGFEFSTTAARWASLSGGSPDGLLSFNRARFNAGTATITGEFTITGESDVVIDNFTLQVPFSGEISGNLDVGGFPNELTAYLFSGTGSGVRTVFEGLVDGQEIRLDVGATLDPVVRNGDRVPPSTQRGEQVIFELVPEPSSTLLTLVALSSFFLRRRR